MTVEKPVEADLSITVADDWQHLGLGAALLRLLSDRARAVGIRRFTMEMLADNEGILALVHAAGGAVEPIDSVVVSGRIDLARPHSSCLRHLTPPPPGRAGAARRGEPNG